MIKFSNRDWLKDFGLENSNYLRICIICGEQSLGYKGYKRRFVCKVCAIPKDVPRGNEGKKL